MYHNGIEKYTSRSMFNEIAPAIIAAGIAAGAGLLGSGLNFIRGKKNAEQNYEMQVQNLQHQKDLQQQIFQREDTAQQRAAMDLQSAGLSKTLAAGSGAAAGQAIATNAPQYDGSQEAMAIEQGQQAMQYFGDQMMKMKEIELSERQMQVQERLVNAQIENMTGQRQFEWYKAGQEQQNWEKEFERLTKIDEKTQNNWEREFERVKNMSDAQHALEKMKTDIQNKLADKSIEIQNQAIANYEKMALFSNKKIAQDLPMEMKMILMQDLTNNSWGNVGKSILKSGVDTIIQTGADLGASYLNPLYKSQIYKNYNHNPW